MKEFRVIMYPLAAALQFVLGVESGSFRWFVAYSLGGIGLLTLAILELRSLVRGGKS